MFKFLPFLFRYNRNYKTEVVDPVRFIIFLSLVIMVVSFGAWLFLDREIPEHLFVGFSAIVAGGLGADIWKTKIKNKDHDL